MKAYRIDYGNPGQARMLDLSYRFQLPKVRCRECEPEYGSWGDSMFQFPAVAACIRFGRPPPELIGQRDIGKGASRQLPAGPRRVRHLRGGLEPSAS